MKPNGADVSLPVPGALTLNLSAWRRRPSSGGLRGFADVEIVDISFTLRGCAVWENADGTRGVSLPAQALRSRSGVRWVPAACWGSPELAAAFSAQVLALIRSLDPDFDQAEGEPYRRASND